MIVSGLKLFPSLGSNKSFTQQCGEEKALGGISDKHRFRKGGFLLRPCQARLPRPRVLGLARKQAVVAFSRLLHTDRNHVHIYKDDANEFWVTRFLFCPKQREVVNMLASVEGTLEFSVLVDLTELRETHGSVSPATARNAHSGVRQAAGRDSVPATSLSLT